MAKTAFITGISGQDGAYLAQLLCEKKYRVHGLLRWDSFPEPSEAVSRLEALGLTDDKIQLHHGDITDANNINFLIKKIQPDEIYNLAGLSQVGVSFETPASTMDINAKGTLNILDAVRVNGLESSCRVYQASSSEMFGSAPAPQNEDTPMLPCSPYGTAKLSAYHLARTYRQSYGMFVSNGILFNHESPMRGEDFVTRKITKAVAEMETGRSEPLRLGSLDSIRDWGDARDYVDGMWRILQHDEADDFVLATGEAHSVREFVERAFAQIGLTIQWQGSGLNEVGVNSKTGHTLIEIDPELFRPSEVNHLLGDASKAKSVLRWAPSMTFDALVSAMVNHDRDLLKSENPPWRQVG